jgi:2-polyprenyl-6-methoxyphenol hydroxylase-like FAD-dependent oxidoreductase
MRVIIVGAGIGGLVTALRLHRQGIDCTVYEQSEPIRE